MQPKPLTSAFGKARARCSLPHVQHRYLRHFGLTMAAATGASTKKLMRRAGDASSAAALRYRHATEGRDRTIPEALSELVKHADVGAA